MAPLQKDIEVDVEVRQPGKRGFGNGIKEKMMFGSFIDRMDAGDETLYLTTQQVQLSV